MKCIKQQIMQTGWMAATLNRITHKKIHKIEHTKTTLPYRNNASLPAGKDLWDNCRDQGLFLGWDPHLFLGSTSDSAMCTLGGTGLGGWALCHCNCMLRTNRILKHEKNHTSSHTFIQKRTSLPTFRTGITPYTQQGDTPPRHPPNTLPIHSLFNARHTDLPNSVCPCVACRVLWVV